MTDQTPVVTRFAPSPTGHLHVGGVRTALFCLALARKLRGRFLLRIEDTDAKRSSEDAAAGILEDLAWVGIRWDEGPAFTDEHNNAIGGDPRSVGPFHQSRRTETYNTYFDKLLERDLAYPAFDTPEELAQMRKDAEAKKRTFIYRRADGYDKQSALARMNAGEAHVLRFRTPDEPVTVRDLVLGDVTFRYQELDDFVIRKADGNPTYHFAVVIDDHLMGVTHVLRGQEHLQNTPRHVALQHALGFQTPAFVHLPLIFNPDGSKMSKRDKDKAVRAACKDRKVAARPAKIADITDDDFARWLKDKSRQLPTAALRALADELSVTLPEIDVEDFRAAGYLPEVLLNYLALLGWNPGEKNPDGTDLERFDLDYLCDNFSVQRVGKSNAKFDRAKLLAFNADTIQNHLADDRFLELWRTWATRYDPSALEHLTETRLPTFARAFRPRARTLAEPTSPNGPAAFLFTTDEQIVYDEKAVKKVLLKNDQQGLGTLASLIPVLDAIPEDQWASEHIESILKQHAESKELNMGTIAQPLRVALTGTPASPALGDTLELVTKPATLARVKRCLTVCTPG